jgi:multiple sugar transport system permease protein
VIVGVRSQGARIRSALFGYANLVPYLFFALFPFYFMLITSLKSDNELYNLKAVPFLIQTGVITDHYRYLFFKTEFLTWMMNSLIISITATAISLVIAILAGYSLARLRFPGVGSFGTAVFITYLVPPTLLFIPLADIIRNFRLGDTSWSLILTYPTFLIPFCTWLMMGFFKTVPMEIEEAARVDGCGQAGAFLRVILPISLPGVLTSVIFAFTLSMQDFLYGLAFVSPGDQKPVPVGVPTELIRGDIYYWGSLMGAALLVGLPVAILYNFFLDRFIQGITGGIGK